MHAKQCLVLSALVAYASAHGVLRSIKGANGVLMPGLSVVDGTPRGCSSAGCGSEQDVSVIKASDSDPLGSTPGFGPVDPAKNIATFIGTVTGGAGAATANKAVANTTADAAAGGQKQKHHHKTAKCRRAAAAANDPETIVGDTAGKGAASGLPTVGDDGSLTMTYHQVNGDGAGPVSADVDPTSGGTDVKAFQAAQVTKQVPGTNGNSNAAATDFTMTVKIPAGITCDATVAGVKNVCIVRVKNPSGAGPFGGSAAFTQSAAGRKRAIAYRMRKRMEFTA